MKLALLDDYQRVALRSADYGVLEAKGIEVTVFHDAFSSTEDAARKLAPFDILCPMRERTPFPRALIEKLPNLKFVSLTGLRAGSIDDGARLQRKRRSGDRISCLHSTDAAVCPHASGGFDVIRQIGSGAIGGRGKRKRQPIGFDHLVVVPLCRARQPVGAHTGKQPQRRRLRDQPRRRQVKLRLHLVIAMPAEPLVNPEGGANYQAASRQGAIRRCDERQRSQEPRCDARERPPFVDRGARAIDAARL